MTAMTLRSIGTLRGPSAADLVFEELYRRVVELKLAPGTKLSEQEVARQMAVSRQPVRDAFYRLSQLGLLVIQPQRATTVSLISEEAVLQARFVRSALETETARIAAERIDDRTLGELDALLARQALAIAADDRVGFHALDDAFHQAICVAAGHGFAWALIRDNKAHMDRVRYLSLSFNAGAARAEHIRIVEALRAHEPERAAAEMRRHLTSIVAHVKVIRAENPAMFAEDRT